MEYMNSENRFPDVYDYYEKRYGTRRNRICIDGRVTGCGNCVGYCRYEGHPGYLTEKHKKEHGCLDKECFYYVPKPKKNKETHNCDADRDMLAVAQSKAKEMEGLRIIRATKDMSGWEFFFISISNDYPIEHLLVLIQCECDVPVKLTKLNYSFDKCVQIIMAS